MDLDGDGERDLISGSYWPGDLYWFRGLGDFEFAAGAAILDENGAPLTSGKFRNTDEPDDTGLASAPCAVDWEGDGDFDLLVGNILGAVILIENVGDARAPRFPASARTRIRIDGAPLVLEGGDAGPTTADWDGDGLWDLIVGAGDGSVRWFRNVGERASPRFATGEVLVPPTQLVDELPLASELPGPGRRAKPHAVDWNGDGRLDLLVGDFFVLREPEPELSADELALRKQLERDLRGVERKMAKLGESSLGEEQRVQAELDALQTEWSALDERLRPLRSDRIPTGRVWLFLRKPVAKSE